MLSKLKKKLIYFNEGLSQVEGALASLLSLILLVAIFWQVICRYILFISTPWAEELGRYMFIGISYIGAGVGMWKCQFTTIDIIDKVFEWTSKDEQKIAHRKLIVEKIALVLSLAFFIWFGIIYWDYLRTIAQRGQTSLALGMNMLIPLSTVMIGTVCMAIHTVCLIVTSSQDRQEVFDALAAKREKRKNRNKKEVEG